MGGCYAELTQTYQIFEQKTQKKIENADHTLKRLARRRAAFKLQCFRSCMLSSKLIVTTTARSMRQEWSIAQQNNFKCQQRPHGVTRMQENFQIHYVMDFH